MIPRVEGPRNRAVPAHRTANPVGARKCSTHLADLHPCPRRVRMPIPLSAAL